MKDQSGSGEAFMMPILTIGRQPAIALLGCAACKGETQ
jgi:hypothetical protein